MMWERQPEGYNGRPRDGYNTKGDSVAGVGGRFQVTKGQFSEIFPCDDPVNPPFSDFRNRLQSFQAPSWHQYRHTPSSERLAAAGLFYLGDRDRCKCYYCNGGLQNWEDGDDPMEEHAKYFPQCEFVLQHKGPDYVAELNAKFPNLSRPGSGTPQFQQSVPSSQPLQNNVVNNRPEHQVQRFGGTQIGSYTNDAVQFNLAPSNEENQDRYSRDHGQELFDRALTFGFDRNLITTVLARRQRQSGTPFSNLGDLIDALVSYEANQSNESTPQRMDVCGHEMPYLSTPMPPREVMADHTEQLDLKSQLQSALNESMCLTCHTQERSCVFMNCGHLSCCYECGKTVKQCPICNNPVLKSIRIYKT